MEKERRVKTLSLVALIVAILGLTIAFAAMSTTLKINGTATMDAATWDVHFANLSNVTLKGDAKEKAKPNISSDGLFVQNINILLTKPKDEATYTVDIVNDGTINAEITSIEKSALTTEQAKIFEFDVRYADGGSIEQSNIIAKKEKEQVIIKVRFKDDIEASDLPKTSQNINLSLKINYVQADDFKIPAQGGDTTKTYNVGDEVCLESECFYVIKDNGNSITALAKYNLLVGNQVKFKEDTYAAFAEEIIPIPTTIEGYGLQNSKALGWVSLYEFTVIGTIEFSSTYYWKNYEQVFNSNSSLYNYVKNYESYLKRRGYKSISARLITSEELNELECNANGCDKAPEFIVSTSYWTGSSAWASDIIAMLRSSIRPANYSISDFYGVRPVITISKSEI